MVVLGRYVGVSLIVMALFAIGSARATGASAQAVTPTPTHLVVGPRIDIPSELSASNPAGSPALVTPPQASAIAVAMWQLWEGALVTRDTTALTQLTPPGPLLEGELYNCAWPSGGCVAETSPRPANNVTVVVPMQHSYPIYFLAEVSTIQDVSGDLNGPAQWVPWMELQVLTKANASSPWQLNFDTGYDGTNHQQPPPLPFELAPQPGSSASPQADWYNPPPTSPQSPPASTFLSLLAQYYQSFKDTGGPPARNGFAVSGGAYGYGSQLATNREGNVALGSRNHYDFTADPSAGEWEFSGPGGLPIECGIVLDTSTNTPVGSPVLSQNADRTNWGMALPPGTYSKIITATTHPTCVDDVADVLDAAGDSGYSVGVSGPNGSIFSAALVIGLAVAVLGVLLVSGLIVGVTVFVTRRRRPAGATGPFVDPAYTWSGGPPGHSPGMMPPPPSWPPPPPPPPPGASQQMWPPPPPSAAARAHPVLPASDMGGSGREDKAIVSNLIDPDMPQDSHDLS